MKVKNKISAFNYFGGKNSTKLQNFILSKLRLIDVFHLAEPFSGSAAVALNFKQARIRTINDINSEVYTFFKVLREKPEQLIYQLELTPYSREEYNHGSPSIEIYSDVEKARRFFLRTCQSFGNSGALKIYNSWSYTIRDSRYGCSQSTARFLNKVAGLKDVVNEMRYMQIENIDFKKFILKYDSAQTVFYVDPPYVHETRSMHQKYTDEMTEGDHKDLANLLLNIKGKFLLSGYRSGLYESLYKDCYTDSIGNIRTNSTTTRKQVIETVWSNYNLHSNKIFQL